jgi:hypothetical protein
MTDTTVVTTASLASKFNLRYAFVKNSTRIRVIGSPESIEALADSGISECVGTKFSGEEAHKNTSYSVIVNLEGTKYEDADGRSQRVKHTHAFLSPIDLVSADEL